MALRTTCVVVRRDSAVRLATTRLQCLLTVCRISRARLSVYSHDVTRGLGIAGPDIIHVVGLLVSQKVVIGRRCKGVCLASQNVFITGTIETRLRAILARFPPIHVSVARRRHCGTTLTLASTLPRQTFANRCSHLFNPSRSRGRGTS